MNLEKRKNQLAESIVFHTKQLENCKQELESLKDCRQPVMDELYNNMKSLFTVETNQGKYEHILGGDGRSAPWSEQRTGLIAVITITKDIYLDDRQKDIVKRFVNDVHKADCVKFKK